MNPGILIIVGIAVMCFMALSIILFIVLYQRKIIVHQLDIKMINEKKQMDLLQASLQSEEEERQRIAGELHDDVGATLASIRLFIRQAEMQPHDTGILRQSGQLVDETLKKIRDISHKLQPTTLQALGLLSAIKSLADIYSNSSGFKLNVVAENEIPRFEMHMELHLYRILQELINNAIRHSKSLIAAIHMSNDVYVLTILFRYDGVGINQEEFEELLMKNNGIGLKNIRSRIRFINGSILFENETSSLNQVTIKAPIRPVA